MPVRFEDERLLVLPPGLDDCPGNGFVVAAHLNRIACSGRVPFRPPEDDPEADPVERMRAVSNGHVGPEYRSVGLFRVSDDGGRWAYVAEEPDLRSSEVGGQRIFERVLRLVVDGAPVAELGPNKFHLSPDGRGLAHGEPVPHPTDPRVKLVRMVVHGKPGPALVAVRKAAWSSRGAFAYAGDLALGQGSRLFVDGEAGPLHPGIEDLAWSPDGSRLAVVVLGPDGRRSLHVDGAPEPDLGEPFRLAFGSTGRLAYAAFADGACRVVVDRRAWPAADGCLGLEFSPDGRRLAAVLVKAGKQFVSLDGQAGKAYADVGSPLMNADGSLLAYGAGDGAGQCVVVNGEESERADLVFRLAVAGSVAAYALKKGSAFRIFHRNRLVRETPERVGSLVLNADGSKLAWTEGGKVHLDGDFVAAGEEPVFAPDGATLVFRSGDAVQIGGKRHGPMRALSPFAFDPAGKRVAVVVQIGAEIWRKVLPL